MSASLALAQQPWHGPYVPAAPPSPPAGPSADLLQAIVAKFSNPQWAAELEARGRLPGSSARMPEELALRRARADLARTNRAPEGATVLAIPRSRMVPSVDGRVYVDEWGGALRIPLAPATGGSVLLLAHGDRLFVGAMSTADKTEAGFDQFRFWFHVGLSGFLRNERIFVANRGSLGQLRDVFVPDPGGGSGRVRTDWNIFERTRGASAVEGFRQFELSADLGEVGLHPGVPFAAFFEVEGDPVYQDGKFKARTILGTAGSAAAPVWLQISPR